MCIRDSGKSYTGKDADAALGAANITVNKNAVPNDPRSPFITSGLRVGTPAVTTRGFKEAECIELANWMCDVLEALEAGDATAKIEEVKANHQYLLRITPKDTSKKTRETCYLTSPDDTNNHLRTFPIYAWIR